MTELPGDMLKAHSSAAPRTELRTVYTRLARQNTGAPKDSAPPACLNLIGCPVSTSRSSQSLDPFATCVTALQSKCFPSGDQIGNPDLKKSDSRTRGLPPWRGIRPILSASLNEGGCLAIEYATDF